MQSTQTQKKEETEKPLILIGHFQHTAKCNCGTTVVVASYYEQFPIAFCSKCQHLNPVETTYSSEPFISPVATKCSRCGCKFTSDPIPLNQFCAACGNYVVEILNDPRT